jgi:hypothetical protein
MPLSAGITPANVYDNQMYQDLTGHLPGMAQYVVADAGYDDQKLYDFSRYRGIRLVCLAKTVPSYKRQETGIDLILQIQERSEDIQYQGRVD